MSYAPEYASRDLFAIDAAAEARATFIRKTYLHLFGAILAFIGIETAIFGLGLESPILNAVFSTSYGPLIVMVAFMIAGWVAQSWAHNATSRPMQYAGLALYTVAEALIFVPILYLGTRVGEDVIPTAGFLSLMIFGGLTAIVIFSGANFSFLRTALVIGGWSAIAVCIMGAIFGFHLGLAFSGAMVVLASGYILYDTSNVLHTYRTDQYVGASLELFASVALLFYYILRIVISLQSRD